MNHVQDQVAAQPVALEDQARHFATQHADEAGNGMLKTIRGIKRRAKWLTILALGASMPHQITYLIALCWPFTHWSGLHAVDSAGMLLVAVAFPIGSDLLILSCIETISTTVASDASRWRAVATLLPPLGFSGYVNFVAPGPMLVKVLAAGLVSYIAFSETLKFVKPDFKKLEVAFTESVKQVERRDPVKRTRFNNKTDKILHLLANQPELKPAQVAKAAGVSVNYVYKVRRDTQPAEVMADV